MWRASVLGRRGINIHMGLLGLAVRNFLISNIFKTNLLTILAFSVFISSINCSFWLCSHTKELTENTDFNISSLGSRYVGQVKRKCTSSSTLVGQNGQNLSSLGVLGEVYLPLSIFKVWLESRNLVSAFLALMILTSSREFFETNVLLEEWICAKLTIWIYNFCSDDRAEVCG